MPFSNIFGVSFLFHLIIVLIELAIRGVHAVLMAVVHATRFAFDMGHRDEEIVGGTYRKTPSFFPNDNVLLIGNGILKDR
ncbi:MAG: hypothetical protein HGA31_04820 [Candidatus Moranbacteria bacterium]|nr:hypothetical protein [Candidatus Moranbacteria bacterium]